MSGRATRHLRRTTGLIAGLLFSVLSLGPLPASAATSGDTESITLSPVSRHYRLDPGASKTDEMTVVNDGTTDYTFTVYVKPYSVNGVEYEPDFYTVKTNTELEKWVSFGQTNYTLKAGQSLVVPFTIKVPMNATPGGHYGVIFAETQPKNILGANSVQRKKRVGLLLYTTVNGNFETGGKFGAIRTPGLQFKAPLKSDLTVSDTGDTDFEVKTVMHVADLFGNTKYRSEKSYQLLPKTTRLIPLEWAQAPGFGFYKVTVSAQQLDETTTHTSYVLMAPIAFYMVFVIGLLILVIYFVAKRR